MTSALVMNIEGVRRSVDAENRIKEEKPDMVAFLQAYRARPWLTLMARKHGYYRHHLRGGQERANICVFLKRDDNFDIISVVPMFMTRDWIGGKAGHHHEPRVYWKVTTRRKGQPINKTVFLHLPTGNADAAQKESVNRLVTYRAKNTNFDMQFLGDFNKDTKEMQPVIDRLNGVLKTVGKVDHGVFCADVKPPKDTELLIRSNAYRDEPGKMQPGAHGWGIHTWRRVAK